MVKRQLGTLARLEAILRWAVLETDAVGGVIGIQFLDKVVCCCRIGNLGPTRGILLDELAGECLSENRTVLAQNLETAESGRASSYRRFGVRSSLVVPVACHGLFIGVLQLLSDRPHHFQVLSCAFQRRLENLCDVDNPRHLEAIPSKAQSEPSINSGQYSPGSFSVASSAAPGSVVSSSHRNALPPRLGELREVIEESSATGTWEDLLTDLAEYLRPEPQATRTG